MRLAKKVALVTGAGAGIGKAIAETFAKEGAKVVVNDMNPATAQAVADGISKGGGTAAFVQADVSKEADAVKIVKFTVDTYGSLDILVNNAGIELIKPTHELTEQDWDSVMNVNLKGLLSRLQARGHSDARPGRREHHQHVVRSRNHRVPAPRVLLCDQGGRGPTDQEHGPGVQACQRSGQRDLSIPDRDGPG